LNEECGPGSTNAPWAALRLTAKLTAIGTRPRTPPTLCGIIAICSRLEGVHRNPGNGYIFFAD